MTNTTERLIAGAGPNPNKHAAKCKICGHPQQDEIEADFINWRSATEIAKNYKLADRSCVYRHAHALDLFEGRAHNLRAALGRIIEQAGETKVNGATVVAAINAYAKFNKRYEIDEALKP